MSKRQRQIHERRERLLPYAVIQAATMGGPDAISAVLHHYSGYNQHVAAEAL